MCEPRPIAAAEGKVPDASTRHHVRGLRYAGQIAMIAQAVATVLHGLPAFDASVIAMTARPTVTTLLHGSPRGQALTSVLHRLPALIDAMPRPAIGPNQGECRLIMQSPI